MNNLFELFKKFEKEAWSGEIQVTATEGNAFIVLEKGRFVYAYRPLDRSIERLRQIPWIDVPPDNVLKSVKGWEELVGILLSENKTKHSRLIRYLKTDRYEIFFRLFFWTNIDLIPLPDDGFSERDPQLSFYSVKDLDKLLLEAETRLREWPAIQSRIQSSHRVFVNQNPGNLPQPNVSNKDAIDEALETYDESAQLEVSGHPAFTDEQIELLRLCDGRNNVQDLIRLSYVGEFLTLRRLIDLWEKGAVAPRDAEAARNFTALRWGMKWKDFKALFILSFAISAILYFHHIFLQPPAPEARVVQTVTSALEIYRGLEGRYPVALEELAQKGILTGEHLDRYDYRLLSLERYEISTK